MKKNELNDKNNVVRFFDIYRLKNNIFIKNKSIRKSKIIINI